MNSPQSKSIYCTSYGINFCYFQIKVTLGKKKHKQKQTKKNKSSKQLPAPEKKKKPPNPTKNNLPKPNAKPQKYHYKESYWWNPVQHLFFKAQASVK